MTVVLMQHVAVSQVSDETEEPVHVDGVVHKPVELLNLARQVR